MKLRITLGILFLLFLSAGVGAQPIKKTERQLRRYTHILAGDEFEGRAAQTRGDTLAMEFLQKFLSTQKGIELLYDNGIQEFTAQKGIRRFRSFNVAGWIEGSDPILKNEVIVIGAHYDHMGKGRDATTGEPNIRYGADDNASGTAMVMALAKQLARERVNLKRSVMIAFFGAEERGLLGSAYMVEHMPEQIPLENVVCMVNFDMVGRLTPERGLLLFNLESGEGLEEYVRSIPSIPADLAETHYHARKSGNSDHASFDARKIPAMMIMTGIHSDYHKPGDTPDKINYYGMGLIYYFSKRLILGLADGVKITPLQAD